MEDKFKADIIEIDAIIADLDVAPIKIVRPKKLKNFAIISLRVGLIFFVGILCYGIYSFFQWGLISGTELEKVGCAFLLAMVLTPIALFGIMLILNGFCLASVHLFRWLDKNKVI